ncbi:hypothetical protein CRE_15862 [Caenorhabditis remanei]|uniref:Uncharacterized protein n=1 Tax=Caenorhabditis remanei TaxID=31234 RepID=E3NW59_CAERE|nr:hypothetical protein CRE_15862 [Caenorhabditis remanei]
MRKLQKCFRWNCSSRDEVTETRHGKFQDILGKTLRSGN